MNRYLYPSFTSPKRDYLVDGFYMGQRFKLKEPYEYSPNLGLKECPKEVFIVGREERSPTPVPHLCWVKSAEIPKIAFLVLGSGFKVKSMLTKNELEKYYESL